MADTFGQRLHAALRDRGPLCVGIDPHGTLLRAWDLPDDARGLERFARTAVEAVAGEVAVVKPQSAFFERHGAAGVAVLERTMADARALGALVLLDAKRGDIGSTAAAYADAYLDPASALAADALTVHPYLGLGSLRPFLEAARAAHAGVFVLALTSNPEGRQVQRALAEPATSVAGSLLAGVAAENAGAEPFGSVGAVVGATVTDIDPALGENLDVNGPLLVPGLGTQGGTPADVARLFGAHADRLVPSVSREVLGAGPDPTALVAAARQWRDALAEALRPGEPSVRR